MAGENKGFSVRRKSSFTIYVESTEDSMEEIYAHYEKDYKGSYGLTGDREGYSVTMRVKMKDVICMTKDKGTLKIFTKHATIIYASSEEYAQLLNPEQSPSRSRSPSRERDRDQSPTRK